MKKYILLLIIVVIIPMFSLDVSAEDRTEEYISEFGDILPDEYSLFATDSEALLEAVGIKAVVVRIISVLKDGGEVRELFLILFGSVLLIGLCSFCPGQLSGTLSVSISVICSLIIYGKLNGIFTAVTESLNELCRFFESLIPITVGLVALGGGTLTAGTQAGGMYLTLSLIGGFGRGIFTILLSFGLAMSLLSAFGSEGAEAVSRGVKGLFMWLVGITTAVITATLALQGAISAASDSAAIRSAKYIASGLIPIVGSTVASALSTLSSGISYARGIIGTASVAVLLFIALSPLMLLLLFRLCFSLAMIFADFTGAGGAKRIFSSYRFSLDSLIAVYSTSVLILVFQIILFLRLGESVL